MSAWWPRPKIRDGQGFSSPNQLPYSPLSIYGRRSRASIPLRLQATPAQESLDSIPCRSRRESAWQSPNASDAPRYIPPALTRPLYRSYVLTKPLCVAVAGSLRLTGNGYAQGHHKNGKGQSHGLERSGFRDSHKRFLWRNAETYGPCGRIRTCVILAPNQATDR
jgi:hypothetical protein